MTQPHLPNPGNAVPLVEGVDPEWNAVLQHVPEDKRSEIVPFIQKQKEQLSKFEPYKNFVDQGVDPQLLQTSMDVMGALENNPKMVYDALENHLGLTKQEIKEVKKQVAEGEDLEDAVADVTKHPAFQQMKSQLDTLSQLMIAEKQEQTQKSTVKQQEEALEKEITALKQKHGDFDEKTELEILMRMSHMDLTAEKAYEDFNNFISDVRKRRPAPVLLQPGQGGFPQKGIDPKKLGEKETRGLVADMLRHSNQEG